jgi:D-xylose transport system permease protein
MADATDSTGSGIAPRRSFLSQLEIDLRLLGMVGALALVVLAFGAYTGGTFLTPRNIFNITIQTVSVAIMATGMVFVIVMRHIDLSVGATLATASAVMAMLQVNWLPETLGLGFGHPLVAPLAILGGLAVGTAIGALHGWLAGYQRIPSFIVTLGGLLVWRYAAYYISGGQTVGPLSPTVMLFGGAEGTLGPRLSWLVAAILAVLATWVIWSGRRSKQAHGFAVKSVGAEVVLNAVVVGAVFGFIAILNAYQIPEGKLRRIFEARGEVLPEGYTAGHGLPISVLILIAVAVVMTVIARKTRFGRYVYAAGGNPDAATLSGIDTRWLTVKVFALLGFLCGLSALVAQARLANHANDIGTLDELSTIAAAVIGGTALAGGAGTIWGAILGALIMQTLRSGMVSAQVDAPLQSIVVGAVLVLAVWLDIQYRRRLGVR